MVSTSGAKLLEPAAIKILKEKLLPLATLVTPNLDEAEILTGQKISIRRRHARRRAKNSFALRLRRAGQRRPFARHSREAVDIFFDGKTELLLSAPFVKGVSHARHRLHLFRRDLRRAGARTRFAARG